MKLRMQQKDNNTELFTKSDEAFTLLLLENYWDRWMDIYRKSDGSPKQRVGCQKNKVVDSDVKPKYTSGGNIYSQGEGSGGQRGKGWTTAGIKRYNELFDWVGADRVKHELFMKRFLDNKRENQDEFIRRRPKKVREIVLPRSELGMDQQIAGMAISPQVGNAGAGSDSDDGDNCSTDEEEDNKMVGV